MYLTDWRDSKIMKASMSGRNLKTLVRLSGGGYVTGLVLDSHNRKIYWVIAGIVSMGAYAKVRNWCSVIFLVHVYGVCHEMNILAICVNNLSADLCLSIR